MKPFLKWAGGKRWLLSQRPDLFNLDGKRLVEPFVGSASVFFHTQPDKALLADANPQLIETYSAVRDSADEVLERLEEHQKNHSDVYYYEVRASKPASATARAARFIYLNRTCWNGLYRVNLRGEFNVPRGSKDTVVLPDDDFAAWSTLLSAARLEAKDFEKTISEAGDGDFLYVDPPYTVQHNNNNFIKYNEHIFSWSDQERLAKCLREAVDRGAFVLVSNADHPSVRSLYQTGPWRIERLERHSVLAASSDRRKRTSEVLISSALGGVGESSSAGSEATG